MHLNVMGEGDFSSLFSRHNSAYVVFSSSMRSYIGPGSPRFARIHCFNVDTEGREEISKYFNASYAALFLEKIASAILSV